MENLVLVVHLLIAVSIIGLILIQQGKGAEAGASFGGGGSQTLFGSVGSWNFFSKATAILATLFFVTSLALAVMARNNAGIGDIDTPELEILDTVNSQTSEEVEIPVLSTEPDDVNPDSFNVDSASGIPELDLAPEMDSISELETGIPAVE